MTHPTAELLLRSTTLRAFITNLGLRLRLGSHLILQGPRGSGKSALLEILGRQNRAAGIPCGTARQTAGIRDVVAALAEAYPGAAFPGLGKRAMRGQLRLAADETSGVLLLDHTTEVTSAMLGYLRRLRGGLVGALLVCDIDTPKERDRYRAWRTGALSVRMPLMAPRTLGRLLSTALQERQFPPLERQAMRQLLQASRGRVGWLVACLDRMPAEQYWRDGHFHAAALCLDTEIALRESRPGPRR